MIRELLLAVALALGGLGLVAFTVFARGSLRRLLRIAKRCGVDRTTLAGRFVTRSPIVAVDGTRAVALRREVRYTIDDRGESVSAAPLIAIECADATIEGDGRSRTLVAEHVILVGPIRRHKLAAAELATKYPALHAVVAKAHATAVTLEGEVAVEEAIIAAGAHGFVAGDGTAAQPLVISAFDESTLIGSVATPLRWLVWIAVVAGLLAALAIGAPLYVAAALGA